MGDSAAGVELVSFHSVSKGFLGEGGVRGGYMELHNIDPAVATQINKLMSVGFCTATSTSCSIVFQLGATP